MNQSFTLSMPDNECLPHWSDVTYLFRRPSLYDGSYGRVASEKTWCKNLWVDQPAALWQVNADPREESDGRRQ